MSRRRSVRSVEPLDGLAQRITTVRQRLGLSQRAFARRLGVSSGIVGVSERGGGVTAATLERIATASGVTAEWLLKELVRVGLFIEVIGMILMLTLALKYYRDFRKGRQDALRLLLGPLLMGLGLAVALGRSFYFRRLPFIPLTAGTLAHVISSILTFAGAVMIVRLWWLKRRGPRGSD